MTFLLDTNIVLRLAQPSHPLHQITLDAVAQLRRQGDALCLVPQNLYEFWAVGTKTVAANGLGLSVAEAAVAMADIRKLFTVLDEPPAVLSEWERLALQCQVTGTRAHDARLAAAMLVHKIDRILTFNVSDFRRYPGIVVLSPNDLVANPKP